jgi:hypothetical protein
MVNMFLNGMFFVQLSTFCGSVLPAEPVFIRSIIFGFSVFDVLETGMRLPFIPNENIYQVGIPQSQKLCSVIKTGLEGEKLPQTFEKVEQQAKAPFRHIFIMLANSDSQTF